MPGKGKWQNRFSGHGRRWTMPRETILQQLSRTNKHQSPKEIFLAINKFNPSIGLTTIYRTLELLDKMGVIHKLRIGDGQVRYELRGKEKEYHHHHLICTSCGKIIDYADFIDEEMELIKKTEKALNKKHNFIINNHNIEFYGLCEKCR